MDTTSRKIKELLQEIKSLIGDSQKSMEWFDRVQAKASSFKTDQEELEYLEDILDKLKQKDEADSIENAKPNIWPAIAIGGVLFLFVIGAMFWYFLVPKSSNTQNGNTNASSTISSVDLPKEDFQIFDYKVDSDTVVYDSQIANTQHKVFANGSAENTLSANAESAVNEMIQYMSHNATALKEKAMTFGIVDVKADVKDWLEKGKDGRVRYNNKGKDVFYQTKAFLSRSQTSSKRMEEGSNYYTTGVNDKGDVVVSKNSQNLSGQEYVEVSSPKDSTEKYSYRVLIYCGNTVLKNKVPGIPTEKIEIPPTKPGKPDKPSESKVEKKDPSKDPANQGKAPVGGGQNDGSNGSEICSA